MNTLLAILLQKYQELQPLLAFLMLILFPLLVVSFRPNEPFTSIDTLSGWFVSLTQRIILKAVCRQ